eukprot:Clim_evm24s158 gene=Clim_evmTU24s158
MADANNNSMDSIPPEAPPTSGSTGRTRKATDEDSRASNEPTPKRRRESSDSNTGGSSRRRPSLGGDKASPVVTTVIKQPMSGSKPTMIQEEAEPTVDITGTTPLVAADAAGGTTTLTAEDPQNLEPRYLNGHLVTQDMINAAQQSRLLPFAMNYDEALQFPDVTNVNQVNDYVYSRNWILALWFSNVRRWLDYNDIATNPDFLNITHGLPYRLWRYLTIGGYINVGVVQKPTHTKEILSFPRRYHRLLARSQASTTVPGTMKAEDERMEIERENAMHAGHMRQHRKIKAAPKIAIIGAGVAGLSCARQLQNFGFNVVVYEALGRVGGRVWTRRTPDGVACDMGAMVLTGLSGNPLVHLLRQLSIPLTAVRSKCPLYDIDGLRVPADEDDRWESAFNKFLDACSMLPKDLKGAVDENGNKTLSLGEAFERVMEKCNQHSQTNMIAQLDKVKDAMAKFKQYLQKANTEAAVASNGGAGDGSASATAGGTGADAAETDEPSRPVRAAASAAKEASAAAASGAKDSAATAGDDGLPTDQALRQVAEELGRSQSYEITDLGKRCIEWHLANLEYGNANYLHNISLEYWDQDDGNEFLGTHVMVKHGYSAIPRGLANGLDVRTGHVIESIDYTAGDDGQVIIKGQAMKKDEPVVTNSSGSAPQIIIKGEDDQQKDVIQTGISSSAMANGGHIAPHDGQNVPIGVMGQIARAAEDRPSGVGDRDNVKKEEEDKQDTLYANNSGSADSIEMAPFLDEADHVVCTVPLGVLQRRKIKFNPELPHWKLDAIDNLGFGCMEKVVLRFNDQFWGNDADTFGIMGDDADRRGEGYIFWSLSGSFETPSLLAMLAGKAAMESRNVSDSELVDRVKAKLKEVFGSRFQEPIAHVVTRWSSDPFFGGSYSSLGRNARPEDYDLTAVPLASTGEAYKTVPISDRRNKTVPEAAPVTREAQEAAMHFFEATSQASLRLLFAGEHTMRAYPATVHGAHLSGLREAQRLATLYIDLAEMDKNANDSDSSDGDPF